MENKMNWESIEEIVERLGATVTVLSGEIDRPTIVELKTSTVKIVGNVKDGMISTPIL